MAMPSANPKIANGMLSIALMRNPAMPPMTAPMPAHTHTPLVQRAPFDQVVMLADRAHLPAFMPGLCQILALSWRPGKTGAAEEPNRS